MDVSDFRKVIWSYTRKINENMNQIFNPICEQYGLTILQLRILMEIYKHVSHTVGSLAESICVAGTNISAMCKKLEQMGLLKRVRDQEDERVVRLVLTAKGNQVVWETDQLLNERISQNMDDDLSGTFDDIFKGLKKLNDLLQRIASADK